MGRLAGALLYKGDNVERQNVIWNIAGSFVYAFASMVLSFLAIRLAGDREGGIFSFGFSTLAQQFFIVAYFGIRPFQITDVKGEFTFGDYLGHRRLTCLLALLGGALFLAAKNLLWRAGSGDYTVDKCFVLFLLVIYKVIDGYADVYESEFQRQGCLYLTGKSNFFRTILSVAVFTLVLGFSGNLLAGCAAAVLAQIGGFLLFNAGVIGALPGVVWERGDGRMSALFSSTWLLFLSVFLDFYVFSSAKYAIDARMNNEASGYFNLIFMPTSVIYMVANFVIRPFLTKLTVLWDRREYGGFLRVLGRIGLTILGLLALAMGGAAVLGRFALSVMELLGGIESGRLSDCYPAFLVVIAGGGFYALANLMYYGLVIMRRQKLIFAVYLTAAAAAALISGPLVSGFGIGGAAVCYFVLMAGLTAGFGLCLAVTIRLDKKEKRIHGGD